MAKVRVEVLSGERICHDWKKRMKILPPKIGWFPKGSHIMGILTIGEL